MRNLSLLDLMYLHADRWTVERIEEATDEELSTAIGIAQTQHDIPEEAQDDFDSEEEFLHYMALDSIDTSQEPANDEPF